MGSKKTNIIRIGVLCLAVVFILIGAYRGEASQVFEKGTTICMSCMGIAK